jgi:hypothetical protein
MVRILNWNIQTLGPTKRRVPGVMEAIGKVIADAQADVVIVVELAGSTPATSMRALSKATRAHIPPGGHDYSAWAVSYASNGESYGLLIRDLDQVRPLRVVAGPSGREAAAAGDGPLKLLDANRFAIWPAPFPAAVNYPLGAPPSMPLVDVWARPPQPRGKRGRDFPGRNLQQGGYAEGRGFRLPCLMMLAVSNGAGGFSLLPVVINHFGAGDPLARAQLEGLKQVDIAQKFVTGRHVNVEGNAVRVQELLLTGDFNVDFAVNSPGGSEEAKRNRRWLEVLTPATAGAGSAPGSGAPGRRVPPGKPLPPAPAPLPPPVVGNPQPPSTLDIGDMDLKTAVTAKATFLAAWNSPPPPPPPPLPWGEHIYDNFFFGGQRLQVLALPPGVLDAGAVVQVPELADVALRPFLGATWTYYTTAPKYVKPAPKLSEKTLMALGALEFNPAIAPAGLSRQAGLVGARWISDHLPVYIDAPLP